MANKLIGAQIILAIKGLLEGDGDLLKPGGDLAFNHVQALANGTGLDQANNRFTDTRTLAASATEDLDLAAVLTDIFGQTLSFTAIVALMFRALVANTNNVEITSPAVNGFLTPFVAAGDGVVLRPGGLILMVAPDVTGYAVVAGTADLITVTNGAGGTPVTYDVVIIGRT